MSFKAKLGASTLLIIGAAGAAWVIHEVGSAPLSETQRVKKVVESRKFQERFGVVPFTAPGLGDTVALRVVPWACVPQHDLPEETLSAMTEYIMIKAKLGGLKVPKLEPYTQITDTIVGGLRTMIVDQLTTFYRIYPSRANDEKALGPDHPDVATKLENMAKIYRKIARIKEADSLEKRAAAIRANKR